MPGNNFLVLDIQTVPDRTLWTPKSESEIKKIVIDKNPDKNSIKFLSVVMDTLLEKKPVHAEDIEKAHDIARRLNKLDEYPTLDQLHEPEVDDEMAPIYAQIPVAIGCVWLDSTLKPKKVGCMKNEGGAEGEKKLLEEWNEFMAREKPTVVTWYGRGFDLPVLMFRSFRYGINMNWYFNDRDYRYRYSENGHADLCDVMADFGAVRNIKLSAVSKTVGLPGKHDNMDGSKVGEYFNAGKIDEICTYCLDDTVQTALVFMRWQLLKGRISLVNYQDAARSLLGVIGEMENLSELCKLIDEPILLLESSESP